MSAILDRGCPTTCNNLLTVREAVLIAKSLPEGKTQDKFIRAVFFACQKQAELDAKRKIPRPTVAFSAATQPEYNAYYDRRRDFAAQRSLDLFASLDIGQVTQ